MAQALKDGNIGVMDYYNLKNITADTTMRDNIAKSTNPNFDKE